MTLPKDVPADHWAAKGVEQSMTEGLLKGLPDGTFGGDQPVTRYELAEYGRRLSNRYMDTYDALKLALPLVFESVPQILVYTKTPDGQGVQLASMGSGIIITEDGLVTTNAHVVGEDGVEFRVHIQDMNEVTRTYKAELVAKTTVIDAALLRITGAAEKFRPVKFWEDYPQYAQPVAAVGAPLGQPGKVSMGIVEDPRETVFNIPGAIQFQAPAFPGVSGGALFSIMRTTDGPELRCIGVCSAGLSGQETWNYAIPGFMFANWIRSQLLAEGKVSVEEARLAYSNLLASEAAAADVKPL